MKRLHDIRPHVCQMRIDGCTGTTAQDRSRRLPATRQDGRPVLAPGRAPRRDREPSAARRDRGQVETPVPMVW